MGNTGPSCTVVALSPESEHSTGITPPMAPGGEESCGAVSW